MFHESVNHHASSDNANAASRTPLRVGLLGLGTVGAGTYRVLTRNQSQIQASAGRAIAITQVAVRDLVRATAIVSNEVTLTSDPFAVVIHPDIDVVVEAIGGTTLARALVLQAIEHDKHVVTANKALLAEHGTEIFAAAEARGMIVAYEGAVAVSIPIIKMLREGLVANRIEWVAGIINGTSNFILSEMRNKGIGFAAALQDAQAKGFAETDPRFDVDGIDAGHKLALLAANAFGTPIAFDKVHIEGIADLAAADLTYAEQLGYRIKLLGLARQSEQGLELRVHPALLPSEHLLAGVEGSMNAVMVKGDASGITLYYGAGAGSEETASAVIADLVDVSRTGATAPARRVPALGFRSDALRALSTVPPGDIQSGYYLRVDTAADVGAVQRVLQTLRHAGIGVQSHACWAHADNAQQQAIAVLTLPLADGLLRRALPALQDAIGPARAIRVAQLD
jgi:homoserine dehydrogenase